MDKIYPALSDYCPGRAVFQGRLREEIENYKVGGCSGTRYADLLRRAKLVAKATGQTVEEIFEQC